MEIYPDHCTCNHNIEDHCHAKVPLRFTKIRKAVYDVIVNESHPIKAYDILERLKDKGLNLTPTTVYRTLDYLISMSMIHKINAINAFVSCCSQNHKNNVALMLICSKCQKANEILDSELSAQLCDYITRSGMTIENNCIEIQGVCENCKQEHES